METVGVAPQKAGGKQVLLQGLVDRDIYFLFRDLCHSHKLTLAQGLAWAMRSLLTQAGIKVKADRGERTQNTPGLE